MSNFTFNVVGLDPLLQRLKNAPRQIVEEVDGELEAAADAIARRAIKDAPTDEGGIRRGINVAKDKELQYRVVSSAKYSPFVEWGTKKQVSIPSSLTSYAAQFKGIKGGSKEEFLKAITGWVRRKGIRFQGVVKGRTKKLTIAQTAYIIYRSILAKGVKPQPFFFHNLEIERPLLLKRVETILKEI